MNYASVFSNTAPKTQFTKAAMEAPLILLDRACTYFKGAFVGCDGALTWAAGTLTWTGALHIYFTTSTGLECHNSVAAGSIALSDSEYAYVTLSETNDAVLTVSKAAFSLGSASGFMPYNRLCLGYRNAADDGFYPEELAGVFTQQVAGGSFVEKSTYNANTVLAATADNDPAAVEIAEQKVLGRVTGGNIAALDIVNNMVELFDNPEAWPENDDSVPSVKSTLDLLGGFGEAVEEMLSNSMPAGQAEITCADEVDVMWADAATQYMTFDRASVQINLTNETAGQVYRLLLQQSAGGSCTVTWYNAVRWRGGSAPTLSTSGNAVDILTFVYINGAWYGDIAANFGPIVF